MKMVNKVLYKLGYSKIEYIQRAQDVSVKTKAKLKAVNIELSEVRKTHKELKDELKQVNMLIPTLGRQKLKDWGNKVKKPNCCDICGGGRPLQAHHLWSKSLHPTLAYEKNNGVALCLTCHEGYHKKYHRIEDCNPYTFNEFKTDEQNKIRLSEVEDEVQDLKKQGIFDFFRSKFNLPLS